VNLPLKQRWPDHHVARKIFFDHFPWPSAFTRIAAIGAENLNDRCGSKAEISDRSLISDSFTRNFADQPVYGTKLVKFDRKTGL